MSAPVKMIMLTSNPFNNDSGIDASIHMAYMDCFEAITAGSDVHIAMYMWNDVNSPAGEFTPLKLSNKLISKASDATIAVIFDFDYMTALDAYKLRTKFIQAGITASYPGFKTAFQEDKGSPKMHNKTMLFSRLKFAEEVNILHELRGQEIEYVIVESSANIWQSQYSQANQLVLYYGNAALYNFMLTEWTNLQEQITKTSLTAFNKLNPPDIVSENVMLYALPRAENLIVSILGNIIAADSGASSSVRIAMGDFSDENVADALVEIATHSNQSVKIVGRTGKFTDGVLSKLAYPANNIDIIMLEKPEVAAGYPRKVHNKYLLYEGDYDLGNGIARHKIIFAGCLNFTVSGLSKNSETFARIADDVLYDKLLKHWHGLRYTDSLPFINAAIQHKSSGILYFFAGNNYVKWVPGKGIETIETNNALRKTGVDGWGSMPPAFATGVDAAFWYDDNGYMYFFKGNKYCKWHPTLGLVAPGIRTIGVDGWELPSVFLNGIDAVFTHPDSGHVYFFKGKNYCEWKPNTGIVAPAVRTLGINGWQLPALFLTGFDAAVPHAATNSIYFFKGKYYCKWKPGTGVEAPAVRTTGKDGWEGLMF